MSKQRHCYLLECCVRSERESRALISSFLLILWNRNSKNASWGKLCSRNPEKPTFKFAKQKRYRAFHETKHFWNYQLSHILGSRIPPSGSKINYCFDKVRNSNCLFLYHWLDQTSHKHKTYSMQKLVLNFSGHRINSNRSGDVKMMYWFSLPKPWMRCFSFRHSWRFIFVIACINKISKFVVKP